MRTVVFDLDGTLADTSADLLAAANACFRAAGHGDVLGPGDALTAFQGGRAMLRLGSARLGLGWGEGEVDRAYPQLLAAYADGIATCTTLYPGVVAALQGLRAKGYATAICTNKPEGLARALVQKLGIAELFGALIGADTLPTRKPDPAPFHAAVRQAGGAPGRALLIGDTETDLRTARNAGVPVVLVAFGPEGPGVARLEPDGMLADYSALSALVGRLLA